jgi:hypothetical protein
LWKFFTEPERQRGPKLISHESRYLFLHPNKCGGKSVEKAIWSVEPRPGSSDHRTLEDYINIYGQKVCDYYTFMFCRNPWDRLVSIYHGRKQILKVDMPTFEKFVREVDPGATPAKSQVSWLKVNGKIMAPDFLGRMERYGDDWLTLSSNIGINTTLPHLNRSAHKSYEKYYTKELANIVFNKYSEDIKYFGYTFGSNDAQ